MQKLSESEWADAVVATCQTIASIEIGKHTASLLLAYRIAHYFNITVFATILAVTLAQALIQLVLYWHHSVTFPEKMLSNIQRGWYV